MTYLLRILEKFLVFCKLRLYPESFIEQSPVDTSEYLCGLSFKMTNDFQVEIVGFIPETKLLSSNEISNLAEKYAELLVSLNRGFFTDKILNILKTTGEDTTEVNELLFLNNVDTYYKLLNIEISKTQNSHSPLVRPISVFRSK
jgi:hypothetical protein